MIVQKNFEAVKKAKTFFFLNRTVMLRVLSGPLISPLDIDVQMSDDKTKISFFCGRL